MCVQCVILVHWRPKSALLLTLNWTQTFEIDRVQASSIPTGVPIPTNILRQNYATKIERMILMVRPVLSTAAERVKSRNHPTICSVVDDVCAHLPICQGGVVGRRLWFKPLQERHGQLFERCPGWRSPRWLVRLNHCRSATRAVTHRACQQRPRLNSLRRSLSEWIGFLIDQCSPYL